MSAQKLIRHYEALVEANPTNVQLIQKLGELYQRAGDDLKAADAFARVAECYAADGFFLKAVALFKQVLKLDPERNDVTVRLGDLHFILQLYAEGNRYLKAATEVALQRKDSATIHAIARKLISAEPTEPQLRLYFAQVLLFWGHKDEARAALIDAAEVLRSTHPDLAETAAGITLADGTDSTPSELTALNAIRLALYERTNLDEQINSLDFTRLN